MFREKGHQQMCYISAFMDGRRGPKSMKMYNLPQNESAQIVIHVINNYSY